MFSVTHPEIVTAFLGRFSGFDLHKEWRARIVLIRWNLSILDQRSIDLLAVCRRRPGQTATGAAVAFGRFASAHQHYLSIVFIRSSASSPDGSSSAPVSAVGNLRPRLSSRRNRCVGNVSWRRSSVVSPALRGRFAGRIDGALLRTLLTHMNGSIERTCHTSCRRLEEMPLFAWK